MGPGLLVFVTNRPRDDFPRVKEQSRKEKQERYPKSSRTFQVEQRTEKHTRNLIHLQRPATHFPHHALIVADPLYVEEEPDQINILPVCIRLSRAGTSGFSLAYWFSMDAQLLILLLVNVIGLAIVGFLVISQLKKQKNPDEERALFKSLVNEVFGEVTGRVTEQSKRVLEGEKEIISTDLKNKHSAIEKVVEELRRELTERQRDLHIADQERNRQFAEVSTRIKEHQEITKELKQNTDQLKNILSNNQMRGQWGEFILDGILRTSGLVEGTHYAKQLALGSESVKPDITLLLPNQRKVAVDVKFPYAAVQKMADAATPTEKAAAKKQFVTDVRNKVKQIVERGYINSEQGTLDYAILFVPNEMLFSFINQTCPEVIEEAMTKRIMIVSPFTFLIVARTIMESYRNFMMENHLRDIVRYIGEFVEEWGRFEGEFGKFDDALSKTRKAFDQIASTRFNRMRLRLGRIEEYRLGMGNEESLGSLKKPTIHQSETTLFSNQEDQVLTLEDNIIE